MDILDWVMYGAGGGFGILTLGLGISRASAFADRDINPIWWLGFIVTGGILAATLITDWIIPIETTVYLANGSNTPRQVRLGDRTVCVPGKSYDDFTWRLARPDTVIVGGSAGEARQTYPISRGTWFINVSPVKVTADMYDRQSGSIDFDALYTNANAPLHVDGRYGRPLRMFSQTSMDRVYSADGDVLHGSSNGPCSTEKPPQ